MPDSIGLRCAPVFLRASLALLQAIALAGCVSTPLPDSTVSLPGQWQQTVLGQSPTVAADPRAWWRAFADPQLDALVDTALSANLDVAQSGARLRAARTLNAHAADSLRPNLAFRTSDPIDPDASASFLVAGFDSVWEFGLFGRGTALHRLSRADLDAADAELREARSSVAAEVARNWIALRSAQQRERLLLLIREASADAAARVDVRARLQLASTRDSAQAQAAVAQADAALAEPRTAAVAAAQRLAVLVGRSEPDPAWLRPGALPRLGAWALTTAPADLLRTRPDIAREQAAVLHAAGELGIAKADRYPHIAIGGSLVWSTSEIERRNTATNAIASFGPIIDIPLFDWGMRRAQAEAKSEALKAASYGYRETVLQAAAEVESALSQLEQQRQREAALARAAEALETVDQRVARRHGLGLASGLDVAASQVEQHRAELDLLDAGTTRALAYVTLGKALGSADLGGASPGMTAR